MENTQDYRLRIVTGDYQKAPAEQKQMIRELFGEDAAHRYEIYFHWYNVVHELGHAIMMFNAPSRPHPIEEEQLVNNFAYAYWMHYGEQDKLNQLRSIATETIQKFSVPANRNESYLDYAKRKWGTEELFSFNNYGWFQFSSVQAAIAGTVTLEQALNSMCADTVFPQKAETLHYETCDHMALRVVADAVRLLKKWGVHLPDDHEIIFCGDVNCHMLQAENLRDGSVY